MRIYLVVVQNLTEDRFQYVMKAYAKLEDANSFKKELNIMFSKTRQAKLAYIQLFEVE